MTMAAGCGKWPADPGLVSGVAHGGVASREPDQRADNGWRYRRERGENAATELRTVARASRRWLG